LLRNALEEGPVIEAKACFNSSFSRGAEAPLFKPILLRVESKAGHGQGKPITKQIEEGTDVWSFLFWQLGVK
jgi:hypothetical protein